MPGDLIAKAETTINAPAAKVWHALVTPADITLYMFGTTVTSDWREGSPITWKGEWKGKPYEDKGVIKTFTPERTLRYTHFSPLSGQPDKPENYHTVTIEITPANTATKVTLSQDGNATDEEKKHSEGNWSQVLAGLKKFVEGK